MDDEAGEGAQKVRQIDKDGAEDAAAGRVLRVPDGVIGQIVAGLAVSDLARGEGTTGD